MTTKQKQTRKQRTFNRISFKERVIIENRYCADWKPVSAIARELNRPVCTITRELNGRPRIGRGKYTADKAQALAEEKRLNQGRDTKLLYEPLRVYVVAKLKIGWSPEQIEGRLPRDYPHDEKMRISYEAIYQHIYAQVHRGGNGVVKSGCEDLRPYLARRHARRQQKGFRAARKVERAASLPSIEARPKKVDMRTRIGDWEGDTMVSRESVARVKSVNERVSGIVFFGRTTDGTANACDAVTTKRLAVIPSEYRITLTQDRGTENFGYRMVEKELKISCYFAHPYCSHERGSNENANGLFRRHFPKGTDFDKITDEQVSEVEHLLNSRPRKRLGFKTPYEVFFMRTGVALDC